MKTTEELLVRVLNHLSEKFKNKLILKGGILLRLYNSPRMTQDIDFILLSDESKKHLKTLLIKTIKAMPEIIIENVEVNSRGIFIDVVDTPKIHRCLIEINVLSHTQMASEPLSTAVLAQKYSLATQIVSAMTFSEAFSHKIAAALERKTTRDLYDLSQMEVMGTFDKRILTNRLSKLSMGRTQSKSITLKEAADILRKRIHELTPQNLEVELYPLLPVEHHGNVLRIIQASVGRLVQKLESEN